MKYQNFITISIFGALLLACFTFACADMTVRVLDVGQGDAILVSSGGQHLLFDAGPSQADVASKVKSYGISKLDYFITSHPDADHIGGAAKVIGTIPIGTYADSGAIHTTKTYENMIQALVDTDTPTAMLQGGESFTLGNVRVDVLAAGGAGGDRGLPRNKLYKSAFIAIYSIIPFSMKFIFRDIY
jgi:beta-lactamase superfamily II metal-dependent hydrolase